jgi:hypothetical protein
MGPKPSGFKNPALPLDQIKRELSTLVSPTNARAVMRRPAWKDLKWRNDQLMFL